MVTTTGQGHAQVQIRQSPLRCRSCSTNNPRIMSTRSVISLRARSLSSAVYSSVGLAAGPADPKLYATRHDIPRPGPSPVWPSSAQ